MVRARRRPSLIRNLGEAMRVLVAGDRGYIGAVMVPVLRAGHEVDGLDLGLYEGCDLSPAMPEASTPPCRCQGRHSRPAGRVRRGALPCGAVG
jgi:hypothetical protein